MNGLTPKFKIFNQVVGSNAICVGPPSFLHFICAEILKNSVAALVRRYGIMDLDFSPPVKVTITSQLNYIYIAYALPVATLTPTIQD